ncbi:uncharacterized protein DS421_16g539140 [Arachis hypogaea]|nr:uncharacterized protein DS421_16g539140 [Arachis hypogaea]
MDDAGVCSILLKEFEKAPLNATQHSLEAFRDEVATLREAEKGMEEEKISLEAELFKARDRERESAASYALAEGLLKKAQENHTRVFRENLELKRQMEQLRGSYIDLEESIAERDRGGV